MATPGSDNVGRCIEYAGNQLEHPEHSPYDHRSTGIGASRSCCSNKVQEDSRDEVLV